MDTHIDTIWEPYGSFSNSLVQDHKNLSLFFLKVKVTQLCPTLCDPMGYTVHGVFQGRIPEYVAFPFSKESSQPRDQNQISCIVAGFFTN